MTADYAAARQGAALFDRSSEGRLEIRGPDRVSWLQGLVTNDVAVLVPGEGCYAAYLTAQGRMISDLRVLAFDDRFLVDVPRVAVETVRARFDQFIIMEDVTVTDVTAGVARLAVARPGRSGHARTRPGAAGPRRAGGAGGTIDLASRARTPLARLAGSRLAHSGRHRLEPRARRARFRPVCRRGAGAGARRGVDRCRRRTPAGERAFETLRSRPAARGSVRTWTPRRFRSRPASSPAPSATARAATSDRKSSCGCRDRGRGRVARRLVGLMPVTSDAENGQLAPDDALVAAGKARRSPDQRHVFSGDVTDDRARLRPSRPRRGGLAGRRGATEHAAHTRRHAAAIRRTGRRRDRHERGRPPSRAVASRIVVGAAVIERDGTAARDPQARRHASRRPVGVSGRETGAWRNHRGRARARAGRRARRARPRRRQDSDDRARLSGAARRTAFLRLPHRRRAACCPRSGHALGDAARSSSPRVSRRPMPS